MLLKCGKNDGIVVCASKEIILKVTAAKIKLSQHFFFDLVWELSDTPRSRKVPTHSRNLMPPSSG
jgi:hypothetical protein